MNKSNIFSILFPSLIMVLISIISYTNILSLSDMDGKGLLIISLVLLFPLLFLVQGVSCAITNTSIVASLLVSILTYLPLMFVFMNESAVVYILYYAISYFIGYFGFKLIIKLRLSKHN